MKFRHLKNAAGLPIATLATRYSDENETIVKVALSRCNTNHDFFQKSHGRLIAERRLDSGRHSASYDAVTDALIRHLLLGHPAYLPKKLMPELVERLKETFTTPKRATQLACG